MSTKSLLVVSVISFAAISLLQAQSPTPAESPAASPAKHRTHKKAEATASPAAVTEASPSPAVKRGRKTKTTAESSPSPAGAAVSASPAAKGGRKTKTTAAPAAVTPSPSPVKKTLGDFFKPKLQLARPLPLLLLRLQQALRRGSLKRHPPRAGGTASCGLTLNRISTIRKARVSTARPRRAST